MKAISINDPLNRQLNESDIINRVLTGEKELYEILLRRSNQKLYRVIRSYLREIADIEDVMQETYLKAFEKLHMFKHSSSFSTWLIRIGINESLLKLKQKGRVFKMEDDREVINGNSILEMPDNHQLNPEKQYTRNEAMKFLERAIDSLDTKYRTVYMLKEVEGLSINDVAICLDLTPSNVKVRLHRAKVQLKESLFEQSKDHEIFEFGATQCDNITESVMNKIL